VTALGAATLDERPARTIAHAATKSVLAFAAAIVWLIRTLHNEVVPSWGGSGASVGSRNGYILGIGPPNRHSKGYPRKVRRGRETHNSGEPRECGESPVRLHWSTDRASPYLPTVSRRSARGSIALYARFCHSCCEEKTSSMLANAPVAVLRISSLEQAEATKGAVVGDTFSTGCGQVCG
jgi:hypothetical protein